MTSTSDNKISDAVIQADDFTVYDSQMNEVKLSDYFGKPMVINFWASWCGPCKSELPAFNSLLEKYKDDVVFLMINLTDGQSDTESSIKQFVSITATGSLCIMIWNMMPPILMVCVLIPETIFIRADGSLYDTRVGAMRENIFWKTILKQLIGGEK